MPTIPDSKFATLTNSSVEILNAIRNYATQNYQDYVPYATPDATSIRSIGAIIMDNPTLQNEFLSALMNRIAFVYLKSKTYENPFSMFKKGMVELGETIEEVFVNISKAHDFDPKGSVSSVFAREKPDVRSAFHLMNYKKFYKQTISDDQLKTAFLSWTGVSDLIAKITEAMYTAANYDEEQTMLYMVAKHIVDGTLYPVTIPTATTTENIKKISSKIKAISSKFTRLSSKYNLAGVKTHAKLEDQILLVNMDFEADMSTEVLAAAFNLPYANYLQQRVAVTGFGDLNIARLNELFADDPNYVEFDSATLEALNAIPAVLVEKDWFMIWDNLQKFTEIYNNEGLYWNYTYHVWKTFSVSPFANNAMFTPVAPTVELTEVQYNGASVSTTVGTPTAVLTVAGGTAVKKQLQFSTDVNSSTFAPLGVKWEIVLDPYDVGEISIDQRGILYVNLPATAVLDQAIGIKATSLFDETQTVTGYVSISEAT